ncbi:MAG: EF-P 5-aminopentanol modification-associated protein YfmF [Candidatus Scatomorpha sp.]|jgi:predicted Zn-dependent peptidase
MEFRREEILPGVFLTALRTDKFKTASLSLSLLTQLDAETASMNALIPNVLRRGTVRCPDLDSLAAYMDGLYGLRVEPVVRCIGEIQAPGFYATFPEDRFLPGNDRLLDKAAELLGELLLTPNTRGGLLLPDYVERERTRLAEKIRAKRNNKDAYAVLRLIELMCAYEPIAVGSLGSEQAAEDIHYVALSKHYKNLIASSPIEVFYCGASGWEDVLSAVSGALETLPRGEINWDLGTEIRMNSVEEQPRVFKEHMDVSQGKLAIGWRLGECMEEPDMAKIRVFNAVYGGSTTSKLFMNVREKRSLCYYASSGVDMQKGLLLVASAVNFENFGAAREEIFAQLEAMRRGEITPAELESARLSCASALRSVEDEPFALESYWLSMNVSGAEVGPGELAAACELVTAEDAAEIARSCECDAEYYLCGKEDAADEPEEN